MDEAEKDLHDYLRMAWRRKWQFLVIAFSLLLIGTVVTLSLTPVYQSSATILIEEQNVPNELVRSTVTSYAAQRLQVIRQRVMTTENLAGLIERYDLFADQRDVAPISGLVEALRGQIALELISAEVIDPRSGRPTEATIAFQLAFEHERPETAQQIANELVSLYLAENLRTRRTAARETTAFLRAEAERLQGTIEQLDDRISTFKSTHAGSLPEDVASNRLLLDRAERDLDDIDGRNHEAEQRIAYLRAEIAGLAPVDGVTVSPAERERQEQATAIVVQLNQLGSQYGPRHPRILGLRAALDELNAARPPAEENPNLALVSLNAQLQSTQAEAASLRQLHARTVARIENLQALMSRAPAVEEEYNGMLREYELATSGYQDVQARLSEAELAEALESEQMGERFSLIEPPLLPTSPDRPHRLAILALVVVLSIGAGGGLILGLDALDGRLYSPRQLMATVGQAPLIVVPHIATRAAARRTRIRWAVGVTCVVVVAAAGLAYVDNHVIELELLWYSLEGRFGPIAGTATQ